MFESLGVTVVAAIYVPGPKPDHPIGFVDVFLGSGADYYISYVTN